MVDSKMDMIAERIVNLGFIKYIKLKEEAKMRVSYLESYIGKPLEGEFGTRIQEWIDELIEDNEFVVISRRGYVPFTNNDIYVISYSENHNREVVFLYNEQ